MIAYFGGKRKGGSLRRYYGSLRRYYGSLRRYYGMNGRERKKTEAWKPNPNQNPEPDPPKNAADCTIFSPRAGIGVLGLLSGLARKPKSAALGV